MSDNALGTLRHDSRLVAQIAANYQQAADTVPVSGLPLDELALESDHHARAQLAEASRTWASWQGAYARRLQAMSQCCRVINEQFLQSDAQLAANAPRAGALPRGGK